MPFFNCRSFRRLGLIAMAAAWAGAACGQAAPSNDAVPDTPPPGDAGAVKPSVAFGFGAASDDVFRGFSRTADRAQGFASVDAAFGDVYAGAWGSNVAFRPPEGAARSGAEVDIYGGWRPDVLGYSLDLGLQYDAFAGQPDRADLDYVELYVKAARSIGPITGSLALRYSPAFTARSGQAATAEAGADYAISRDWTASLSAGRQWVQRQSDFGAVDHLFWSAAIARSFGEHLSLAVRYVDSDRHRYGQAYGSKLVGELRTSF
jgi:uncharacterized protein (TIGR02001 family)